MAKHLRIAVAQINTTLGDFEKNSLKILSYIDRALDKHCDLVIFPESTIFGYHPFDLLERVSLVDQQLKQLTEIEKKIPVGITAVIGVITKNKAKKGRPYFNSSAIVSKGKKTRFFHKELLPTGDVFDEARFIENGKIENNFFSVKGKKILVTLCEDIWAWPDSKGKSNYRENPLLKLKGKKVDLIINQSASPFYLGKLKVRKELAIQSAKLLKVPLIYTNLIGAQDEIIFDGSSFAVDAKGSILLRSLSFEEDLNVLDLEKREGGIRPQNLKEVEILRSALVLGIRDFCIKTGLKKVHLGLSGGVDSALVACLAVDAMGAANVKVVALPTEFNSPESLILAKKLASQLRVELLEISIQEIYKKTKSVVDQYLNVKEFGLVHENLQARIRGLLLMAIANQTGSLLLTTSNKSELAAGYATLYGDLCGGLAPIGDLTKKQVYEICEIYNSEIEIIPKEILNRAPSAELRPGQTDQQTLPPYDDLDDSVVRLVENCESLKTKTDFWLMPALLRSEFKRWQAPPILKISKHSFGRGRRYPIAQAVRGKA